MILNAPSSRVLRLTPPLVITDEEIHEAAGRIAAAIDTTKQGV